MARLECGDAGRVLALDHLLAVLDTTREPPAGRRAAPVHPCGATGVDAVELVGATPPLPGLPFSVVGGAPTSRVHLTGCGTVEF